MHFLLSYELADDYMQKRVALRSEHLNLAREAFDRGELILAGALADPIDTAVLVFRGPTPTAAESFVKSDPYVKNGLVKSWRVRQWMTVLGDGATVG